MSHFYGSLKGTKGEATRCGDKKNGLRVTAASWSGAISVYLRWDEKEQVDKFYVAQEPWGGSGVRSIIAEGIVGKKKEMTPFGIVYKEE